MRRGMCVVLALTIAMLAGPAFAGKIGFVDAERAVMQVKEGQAELKKLEQWVQPQREILERGAAKVNEVRERINSQQAVASAETLEALQREELDARRELEDLQRKFDREAEAKQQEFFGSIAKKVGTVTSDYGKANGYDAIFILQAQPLIYINEAANLTETVIRLYDERFPVN